MGLWLRKCAGTSSQPQPSCLTLISLLFSSLSVKNKIVIVLFSHSMADLVLWTVWSSEQQLISFENIFWSFHNYILIPVDCTKVLLLHVIKYIYNWVILGIETCLKHDNVILKNFHVKTSGQNTYTGPKGSGGQRGKGWTKWWQNT